jgi:hypothetical protein
MKHFIHLIVFYLSLFSLSHAAPQTFSSGNKQVNVIELYTSEGCSSCPPAEEWLNSFKQDDRLWKEIIPLAFHVDYWDYIGWPDRFADPKFADRQRYYVFSEQLSGVYTPGVMLNGREWRGKSAIDSKKDKAGQLILEFDNGQVDVRYVTKTQDAPLNINIAVLGFDLVTEVKRGENQGRELVHDFVVLGHDLSRLQQNDTGEYCFSSKLPTLKMHANKLAIVAWVNRSKDLTPIQATGGWLLNE